MEWLENTLDKGHPFFLSKVYASEYIRTLSSRVQTGSIHNTVTHMRATGVPPITVLSHRIKEVEKTLQEMTNEIGNMSTTITNNVLLGLKNNSLQPQPNVTMSISSLSELSTAIVDEIQKRNNTILPQDLPHQALVQEPSSWWLRSSDIQRQNLTCPKGKVSDLWSLWWNGIPTKNILPLRLRKPKNFAKNLDRVNFSKLVFVLSSLMKHSEVSETNVPR